MRLGFYYHIPAITQDDKILMPGYLGRFLDSLANHFESIVLFQHLPDFGEKAKFDYEIRSANVKLISLPPRGSVPYRVFHLQKYLNIIRGNKNELDAILLRGPSPLLPAIADSLRPIPTILLIVGDQLAGVDSLPQPKWRKELIRIWSWYNAQRQLQIAKRSLTFVNSRVLYNQFDGKVKDLEETRTTTLTKEDLYYRKDTCQDRPIHLLYTGRMDPAKGLLDMVEAVALLVEKGEDAVLDLVGWLEKGSNILSQIEYLAAQRGIKDRIIYHGYKAVGPELFAFYKKADIYIIASQSSFEGFPRTIWEAMAHSLPVVATKVGSIPDFINQAAELVQSNSPSDLAKGISQVIYLPAKRREHIAKGLLLAHQNSLENQVGEMARVIKNWIASDHE